MTILTTKRTKSTKDRAAFVPIVVIAVSPEGGLAEEVPTTWRG